MAELKKNASTFGLTRMSETSVGFTVEDAFSVQSESKHVHMQVEEEPAFVKHMVRITLMEKIYEVLRCVRLVWSTSNKVGFSKTEEWEVEMLEVDEWFGIKPLSSILRRVSVARERYPMKPVMHRRH